MGLVIKAALGALVVLLIGVLAKTKNYYIAGLIPLSRPLRLSRIILLPANAALKPYAQPSFLVCGRLFPILFTWRRYGISPE